MDTDQLIAFFSEKIKSIKKEIEDLSSPANGIEKEKLKELRQLLEIVYIFRKQNELVKSIKLNKTHDNQSEIISEQKKQKINKSYERLKEKELEEWKLWLEKNGYGEK